MPDPPGNYVLAQLQQAKNLYTASTVREGGDYGDGTFSYTPRPLDKTIRGIIRPIDRVIDRDATARHAARRAEMTSPRCVAQLLRAARFIEQAPPSRIVNPRRSTYGWKHVAERFHKAMDPSGDCYVGEGMFILAARAMGLMVHVDRHEDTYVNLSERAATPWGDSGDGAAP